MNPSAGRDQRRALRLRVARRQIPEILTWAGALTLLFAVVNVLTLPGESVASWMINLIFGPLFLIMAWVVHAGRLPDAAVPWIWAGSSLVLVALLVNAYRVEPSAANLAYVVAVITAFGPLTHDWAAFAAAAVGMVVVATVGFMVTAGDLVVADVLVCIVAVAISGAMLRLRIGALDDLADAQAQLDHQAMYDPLSDVLNRHGLERALPGVVAGARRSQESVLVWFVDVRGLKTANDRHGHELGDAIIAAVAHALRASVRTNDLVARWGGDEFVVIGTGRSGSAEELNARVDAELAADAHLSGRWVATVSVGHASGSPDDDVYRLISVADEDMYRRRGIDPGR